MQSPSGFSFVFRSRPPSQGSDYRFCHLVLRTALDLVRGFVLRAGTVTDFLTVDLLADLRTLATREERAGLAAQVMHMGSSRVVRMTE